MPMTPQNLNCLARDCGIAARPEWECVTVSGVVIDSRRVEPGFLFVALRGDRFDGHDYLEEAIARGAVAVVAEAGPAVEALAGRIAVLAVSDTQRAFSQIASGYRGRHEPVCVAVAGSNGKTTTKDILGRILGQAGACVWSEASFNNHVGVPLTLLRLERGTRYLVLEVGTNHPGELGPLLDLGRPEIGVLTSLGPEHLEYFGDLSGVVEEEGVLAERLPATGLLVVNGDAPMIEQVVKRSRGRVLRVGYGEENEVRVTDYAMRDGGIAFRVEGVSALASGSYWVAHLGRHQALNTALAITVAAELGMDRGTIQLGLSQCKPSPMRMQVWMTGGIRVLDDCYNANEDSMRVALETLREVPTVGRRVAVLGGMAELGAHAESAHRLVGRHAARAGLDHLFVVGRMGAFLAEGARTEGFLHITELEDVDRATCEVPRYVASGDTVLIKASRASRLEAVGTKLRERETCL